LALADAELFCGQVLINWLAGRYDPAAMLLPSALREASDGYCRRWVPWAGAAAGVAAGAFYLATRKG
jgi:hypothetical protein